ncbi:methyltransferase family protein [Streptomyces sp. 846.5]|nr:methyltransferase family protein [Streptomyces sp. 846.5]
MMLDFRGMLLDAMPPLDPRLVVIEIGGGKASLNLSNCLYLSIDAKFIAGPRRVQGSVDALPVRSAYADIVIGSRLLCSVVDIPHALDEVKRILSPEGVYVGLEHCRDPLLPLAWVQLLRNKFRAKHGLCHLGLDVSAELDSADYDISIKRRSYPANPIMTFVATPR